MFLHLDPISLSSHFVGLCVCFCESDETASFPDLEGVVLCSSDLYVGCMCQVVLAGWLVPQKARVVPKVTWQCCLAWATMCPG